MPEKKKVPLASEATMLDWFAAHAIGPASGGDDVAHAHLSKCAYARAKAMLAVRDELIAADEKKAEEEAKAAEKAKADELAKVPKKPAPPKPPAADPPHATP